MSVTLIPKHILGESIDNVRFPAQCKDLTLTGKLGEGTFGNVFLGKIGPQEVAVKVYKHGKKGAIREGSIHKQMRESGIKSDYILPLHRRFKIIEGCSCDHVADNFITTYVFVFPRVKGNLYDDYLKHGRTISLVDSETILYQLVKATEACKKMGILHTDIKPENVHWLENERRAVLIDFGGAKSLKECEDTDGEFLGTTWYRSPFNYLTKKIGPEHDLWGIGCLVFEAYTGKVLFKVSRVKEDPTQEDFDHLHQIKEALGTPPTPLLKAGLQKKIIKGEGTYVVEDDLGKLKYARPPSKPIKSKKPSERITEANAKKKDGNPGFFIEKVEQLVRYEHEKVEDIRANWFKSAFIDYA